MIGVKVGNTSFMGERNQRGLPLNDREKIGVLMQQWHGGMGDAIYAVGSYYYSGQVYPDKAVVERAISNHENDLRKAKLGLNGWGPAEVTEIKTILKYLRGRLKADYGAAAKKGEVRGRATHLVNPADKSHVLCGERAYADTAKTSIQDVSCYYCKLAWDRQIRERLARTGKGRAGGAKKPAARKPVQNLSLEDTKISQWSERDRNHIALLNKKNDDVIIEWWDDDAIQAVEDGFLNPKRLHRSAFEYAVDIGLIKAGSSHAKGRAGGASKKAAKKPAKKAAAKKAAAKKPAKKAAAKKAAKKPAKKPAPLKSKICRTACRTKKGTFKSC